MGFIYAGVPSTAHKREKKISIRKPVYNNINHGIRKEVKSFKKRKVLGNGGSYGYRVSKIEVFEGLPVEVLQRIFVMVGNDGLNSMLCLNSYFNDILQRNSHLTKLYFIENYIREVFVEGDRKFVINVDLFRNTGLSTYFLRNVHKYVAGIHCFVPDHEFKNDDLVEFPNDKCRLSSSIFTDYGILFEYCNEFLLLKQFFSFKSLNSFFVDLINWYFERVHFTNIETVNEGLSMDRLITVIKMMIILLENEEIQTDFDSPEPLVALLLILYQQYNKDIKTNKSQQQITDTKSKQFEIIRNIVQQFLQEFYSHPNSKEYLSHPDIWDVLHKISDIDLIDLMTESGGQPQYNVFF